MDASFRTGKRQASKGAAEVSPVEMETFVSIARSRTLSEAAQSLGLPLPTVSRSLKRLESAAKLILVRRDRSGLHLTSVGRDYLLACEAVLKASRAASDVLRSHRQEPRGALFVGAPIAFVRHVIAPILPAFLVLHPHLTVEIDAYSSGWGQEPRGVHDIFIKVRPPRDSVYHMKLFPSIRRGLYASPAYVAEHGSPAEPVELTGHSCLGDWSDLAGKSWTLHNNSKVQSVTPDFRVEVADPDVLTQLAIGSVGIAPLSRWRAYAPLQRGELVSVLPKWEPDSVLACALYGKKERSESKVDAFLSLLIEVVGTGKDPRAQGEDPRKFFRV